MRVMHERCAGLDVHKDSVYVCIRVIKGGEVIMEKRRVGTTTAELLALAEWLLSWEVTQVVMESTGVYWRPVFNILESSFSVMLCNAQHVKQVPGRKSDASDSEWLAELLQYGLLRGSFIPPPPVRELRELTRTRLALVQEKTEHANRVQKVLETANIKLASVASDVLGVSGRRILKALCEGHAEPAALADLARGTLRNKRADLEQALTGRVADHHRFLLGVHLEMITSLERKIEELSERIERIIREQQSGGADPRPFAAAVALLKTMPGVADRAAQLIIGEIGTDMSRFPTSQHLSSWGAVAPGMNTSGERRKPAHVKKGNTVLKSTLVQAAWAAIKNKDSYLHALFCRVARKEGKQVAIVAVAHSMLVSIYHMLMTGEEYRDLGPSHFDRQDREHAKRSAIRRLEALGYRVALATAS